MSWANIALFLSTLLIAGIIFGTIIGYHLVKYVFTELRPNHFTDYSKKTQLVIQRWGAHRIRRAHIVHRRVPRLWLFGIYILRLFLSEDLKRCTIDTDIFHHSLMVELEDGGTTRFIILEKTCELTVRDSVHLSQAHTLTPLTIDDEPPTLVELLDKARRFIGDECFFNWRTDHTCQTFVGVLAKLLHANYTTTVMNDLSALPTSDARIFNHMMFYYYKVMRMLCLDMRLV
jgi:hypothetical protein